MTLCAVLALGLSACRPDSRLPTTPVPMGTAAAITSTVADLKVAFIGDQGLGPDARAVLQLILSEGAHAVFHQGDFDYLDNPDAWDQLTNDVLGPSYPLFASIGNHDSLVWPGYQQKLQQRLARIPDATCTGDLGVQAACKYKGLSFLLTAPGIAGSGHDLFIRSQLAQDSSLWRVCSWHKNQRLMQVGSNADETGWGVYEECRRGGGIVATAHHHSYSRTHLLDNFRTQGIASTSSTLRIDRGKTFAFVSGLGGNSVFPQTLSGPWWASIYTSTQGAAPGALFCTFHVDNQPDKARCYFKDIGGRVPDQFNLVSNVMNTQEVLVVSGSDEAEQCGATGAVTLTSTDLELVSDPGTCSGGTQQVGMRFPGITVPPGATITSATIQFTVDEVGTAAASVTFRGQAIDDAPTFTTGGSNISSRVRTTAAVAWNNVPAWSSVGAAGPDQRTPNLAAVIQELVGRPGWVSGNDVVIIASTGSGTRTAYSYEGSPSFAPRLALEWSTSGEPPPPPPPPPNQPPIASAGPDQSVADLNGDGVESVTLNGSGSSDPDGTIVAYEWREGTTVLATTATVTPSLAVGSHALILTVTDDKSAMDADTMVVTVQVAGGTSTQNVRVATGSDDAEQCGASGAVNLTSTDLELVSDSETCSGGTQQVGFRFPGIAVPPGATITSATIQFTVDEVGTAAASVTFRGQAIDDAPTFTTGGSNISSRVRTTATVAWNNVPAWSSVGAAGPDQRTPNLAAIIQELVGRPGWVSGNDVAIIATTGSGTRTAYAYNGSANQAPLLALEWSTSGEPPPPPPPPPNQPPIASAGPDQSVADLNGDGVESVTLNGSGSSDPDGTIVAYEWREGATVLATTATVTPSLAVGSHALILTVTDDKAAVDADTMVVTVGVGTPVTTQNVGVVSSSDDAEQCGASGAVNLTSTDLELVSDAETCSGGTQQVGLRFRAIAVPPGATITSATIQFTVDEAGSGATSLTFYGQAIDDAPTFTTAANSISSRTKTAAAVVWNVPAWSGVGTAGPDQRTPNLAAVIQELVGRPGWVSGNDVAIIMTGSGTRTGYAYNGSASRAPLLVLQWQPPGASVSLGGESQ